MTNFTEAELFAGMVVHLSPDSLKTQPGVQTNVDVGREVTDKSGRNKDDHYFLLLEKDNDGQWLCMPLFSRTAPGSEALSEALKGGEPINWIGQPSYVSRFQHWKASGTAIVNSQKNDTSSPGNRRTYAVGNPSELGRLSAFKLNNRNQFRPVGAKK